MNPNHITEHDLLALHLNELPVAQARALRQAIALDPALSSASAEIAATLDAVAAPATPMPLTTSTLDRNWLALRSSLAVHSPVPSRWQLPLLATGLLAATAAGVVFLVVSHHPTAPAPTNPVAGQSPAQATNPLSEAPSNLLTAAPRGSADPHPREPGFRANFTSGVYHPQPHEPNFPIHRIGLAPQRSTINHSTNPVQTPPLTLLPTPVLTTEPTPPPPAFAMAQPSPTAPSKSASPAKPHRTHPVDLMLGVGGTFIPQHHSTVAGTESATLTATHAIVAIAAVHQQFRPALGYRLTFSYTRPQLSYAYSAPGPGGFYQGGAINTRIFEAAGTYVVLGPHHKRLTTTADVGGALMAFLPTVASPDTSYGYRAAAVLGVNVDYALTKHVGARLAYRAQLFRAPDFRYSGGVIPVATPLIVDNEPSLGVTYTFGKK